MGQRQYLGTLAAGVLAAAAACRSRPAPAPFPTGHGPIHRLLRSQPARRLNQNQLFSSLSYCLLSPAAIVVVCLFLAICSWISLSRDGLPQGCRDSPSHSIAPPVPCQALPPVPAVVFHQVSPDVESQLSKYPSPPACVLSSVDQRGASGRDLLSGPPLPAEKGVTPS